jgi:hypothetical protein
MNDNITADATPATAPSCHARRPTTRNVGEDKLLWASFLVSAAVTVVTQSEAIWLFLGAGVLVWLVRVPPYLARKPKDPS